jgi:hypothetical protein
VLVELNVVEQRCRVVVEVLEDGRLVTEVAMRLPLGMGDRGRGSSPRSATFRQ